MVANALFESGLCGEGVKVLSVAPEGGKSSQASLNYANVGLRFLLSIDSGTLGRVARVQHLPCLDSVEPREQTRDQSGHTGCV